MICSNVDVSRVLGIGFDATCSLVVLDEDFRPLSVSPSGKCYIILYLTVWAIVVFFYMLHKDTINIVRYQYTVHIMALTTSFAYIYTYRVACCSCIARLFRCGN